jgi:hypothetical protein
MAQISEQEWMRQYRPDEYARRVKLGLYSPGPTPQPQNVPGLPAPDEVASELRYAQSFADAAERQPEDRLLKRIIVGGGVQGADKVILPKAGRDERTAIERAMAEEALNQEMARQRGREILQDLDPRSPFAAVAGGFTPEQVFSAELGRPVSATIAARAADYVRVLDLTPDQAVKLAEVEAAGDVRSPDRARRQPIPASWLQKIAESGELTPDPAARAVVRAAMEGVLDEETPIEAQARALDPYLQAAEAISTRSGEPFRELSEAENADIAATTGYGRKLPGGRRNPNDKNVRERLDTPYLVPALLAAATEEYASRGGGGGIQPPTVTLGGQRLYDPRKVSLGLLDPRAELPADLGYLRPAAQDKQVSGGFGRDVNVPTLEALTGELHGLPARDDIAATREYVPMTLGQAVQDIIYRNRTPLAEIPHNEVIESPDGQLINRRTGQKIYPARQQSGGAESATYRIGSNSEFSTEAFREFGDLIEKVTGQRVVVNEKLRDPGLQRLQRAALGRALPDDALGVRGPTRGAWDMKGNLVPGVDRSLPVEGSNPTYDLMRALARGGALPPAETAVPVLAQDSSELAFYRDLLGDQMASMRAAVSGPQKSALNAPAPQVDYTPQVAAAIPDTARTHVEAGLAAPQDSPRRRAAVDFLQRFMGRLGR